MNALEIAKKFHETYERLAPSFGYETRLETREFDPDSKNGRLMLAVCDTVGNMIASEAHNLGFESGFRAALLEAPSRQGSSQ